VSVLSAVAERIAPGSRVAIDGIDAAGKSTFADRVSVDDFLRPEAERHRRRHDFLRVSFEERLRRVVVANEDPECPRILERV
jgi:hypothetical protein